MKNIYDIRRKVSDYIQRNNMIEPGDTVIAGVSGGADSMCLLNILIDMRQEWIINIAVVHIHHGIRGKAADDDMEYVEKYCMEHKVEYRGIHCDIPALSRELHMSEEETGRLKRYEAFENVKKELESKGARCRIAVAHNQDDNCETFLFNLFRGSGIKGLTGISPVRDDIIRPVLCLNRREIEAYLAEKNADYRVDATNLETEYARNKIRLKLMPYIKENINCGAEDNINRTSFMLSEISGYLDRQAQRAYITYVTEKENICIDEGLWQEDNVIIKMVIRKAVDVCAGKLKDITAKHTDSIVLLGKNHVSKEIHLPYGITAVRNYGGVELKKEKSHDGRKSMEKSNYKASEFTVEQVLKGGISIDGFKFTIEKNNDVDLSEKMYTKWMKYDILKGNLSVRTRQAGDYMVIDNCGRRKKLKDMMIDMKIPREERDNVRLLAKGSEILWMAGYRMSESCKINNLSDCAVRVDYTLGTSR